MNMNLEFGTQTSLEQEQYVKVNINPADRTMVFLKEHHLFSMDEDQGLKKHIQHF